MDAIMRKKIMGQTTRKLTQTLKKKCQYHKKTKAKVRGNIVN